MIRQGSSSAFLGAIVALLASAAALPVTARAQGPTPPPQSAIPPESGSRGADHPAAAPISHFIAEPSLPLQVGGAVGATAREERRLSGVLTLAEAVRMGLAYNISAVGLVHAARQARAQADLARSALRPSIVGWASDSEQKINLAAAGLQFDLPIPGFTLPESAGPFNVVDLRARLSQALFDEPAKHAYRAAVETARASDLAAQNSKDAIALVVGSSYLQAVAAQARFRSASSQIETARTLLQRVTQQRAAGLAAPIDVNRAQLEVFRHQQRLTALQVDFGKQKIALARLIGMAPTDQYDLETDVAFSPAPGISVDDAVRQAAQARLDIKVAESRVRAAELALAAAQASHLPSVTVNADYGVNRANAYSAQQTYSFSAAVKVPIWEGGRTQSSIEQAQSVLEQRRAELDDVRGDVEAEVRKNYLDLQAAVGQIDVARMNVTVSADTLRLARQRFDAGVGDNVAVVQSQEMSAAAELDYITSVLAHNLSKLELARAVGRAADGLSEFLKRP